MGSLSGRLVVPTPDEVKAQVQVLQVAAAEPHLRPPVVLADLSRHEVGRHLRRYWTSDFAGHATYLGRYTNQSVFGFHHLHALVGTDLRFNCQDIDGYRTRLNNHIAHPPPANAYLIPEIISRDADYRIDFSRVANANGFYHVRGHTFFGSPIEPANWGMWLLHGLISAYAFVAGGQQGSYLCYAPEPWQQHLLHFIGVDRDRLVIQAPWQTYQCDEISLMQFSAIDLTVDDAARALFTSIVNRCAAFKPTQRARRLLVVRKSITARQGIRRLMNEDELIEKFSAHGFVTVEPERLRFEEQVALFHQAGAVVGLGGAAMFNTVFCPPQTKVVSIEGTSAFALNHARLFGSLDHDYAFVFGDADPANPAYPHGSWVVDVDAALRAILDFV